jgi:hypothetical protein
MNGRSSGICGASSILFLVLFFKKVKRLQFFSPSFLYGFPSFLRLSPPFPRRRESHKFIAVFFISTAMLLPALIGYAEGTLGEGSLKFFPRRSPRRMES